MIDQEKFYNEIDKAKEEVNEAKKTIQYYQLVLGFLIGWIIYDLLKQIK